MSVVKWKYRVVSPGVKGHTIDRYIKYVEKQVKERRSETGVFAIADSSKIIGTPSHDKTHQKEKSIEDFDQEIYGKYMDERKGSSGMFSNPNTDILEVVDSLKEHNGCVWIPIVSLKEDEARTLMLESEQKWMEKAAELAEEYRRLLDIPSDNFRWVAAFHTKAPEDQNKQTDSGCQPHLHFMLWEEEPIRSRYSLAPKLIDEVREKTASILSNDYMKQHYEERNKLREQAVRDSLDYVSQYSQDVQNLVMDIQAVMKGRGKMNVAEFEKREALANSIAIKMQTNEKLSQTEIYYKDNIFKTNSLAEAQRVALNYSYLNEELENITVGILQNEDIKKVLDEWTEISNNMRLAQEEVIAAKLNANDFEAIKRRIKNGILDECKDASYDNTRISPQLRGVMIEKLQEGHIKRNTSLENTENTLEVLTSLCRSLGLPQAEASETLSELLERSEKQYYEELKNTIVEEIYLSNKYGMNVTSRDFYDAMKTIGMPITKQQSFYRVQLTENSPYGLASSTVLSPLATCGADLIQERYNDLTEDTAKDLTKEQRTTILEGFSSILFEEPKTKEEYESSYYNLLDLYSSLNQSMLSRGDEIEIREELERIKR